MILNNKQLKVAQKEIVLLDNQIHKIERSNDLENQLQLHTWNCRRADLASEIEEYLKLQTISMLEFDKNTLPKAIMNMRIASGFTQKSLADTIGIQEQQIQRYEKHGYLTASFERIIQIIRVLNKTIILKAVVKNKVEDRFQSIKTEEVENAMQKVREREGLIILNPKGSNGARA